MLQSVLGTSGDVVRVSLLLHGDRQAMLWYLQGLEDDAMIREGILHPLQAWPQPLPPTLELLAARVMRTPGWTRTADLDQALDRLLRGDALLLVDEYKGALLLSTRGGEKRPPDEPINEPTVRGPQDGFVESLSINRSLIRRRLIDPALRLKTMTIGRDSRTQVDLVYLEGRPPAEILQEVRRRLKAINTAGILDAGMIAGFIEDSPLSPFPQINSTSRPDKVVASLMEGRVAVVVDQSPSVLILPNVFWDFLHVPEDYYERWWAASALRLLRLGGVFLSLTLPALWIILISFHQEMLPTALALSIASGRERVPVPALLEILAMEVTFEFLREAGARLPRAVGQTVGIVGGLVIGQAAVEAGLVSPSSLIVVAMTGMASFLTPSFSAAYSFRLLRFAMLLASGTFGILGFCSVLLLILLHLLHLKSFGVDFLSPVLPYMPRGARESVTRPSWRALRGPGKRWWGR